MNWEESALHVRVRVLIDLFYSVLFAPPGRGGISESVLILEDTLFLEEDEGLHGSGINTSRPVSLNQFDLSHFLVDGAPQAFFFFFFNPFSALLFNRQIPFL